MDIDTAGGALDPADPRPRLVAVCDEDLGGFNGGAYLENPEIGAFDVDEEVVSEFDDQFGLALRRRIAETTSSSTSQAPISGYSR